MPKDLHRNLGCIFLDPKEVRRPLTRAWESACASVHSAVRSRLWCRWDLSLVSDARPKLTPSDRPATRGAAEEVGTRRRLARAARRREPGREGRAPESGARAQAPAAMA